MEVYRATAYDKCDKNRSYETYIAMADGGLDADQLFHIEQALIMYIDYLRDGDDDDKETAKKVEEIYDYIKENS